MRRDTGLAGGSVRAGAEETEDFNMDRLGKAARLLGPFLIAGD